MKHGGKRKGSGRKRRSGMREKLVACRITSRAYGDWQEQAAQLDMSLSEFVRHCVDLYFAREDS